MKNKTIKLVSAILAALMALTIGFMAAYVVTTENYRKRLVETVQGGGFSGEAEGLDRLETIINLIKKYSYYEMDEDELSKSFVNGFISVKNDKYAYYYTAEEYAEMTAENQGDMEGIGVSVIYDADATAIKIISVFPESPALEAGLRSGDLIVEVKTEEGNKSVADIGYENALTALKGKAGTYAEFGVKREGVEDVIQFKIGRAHVVTRSVEWHVYDGLVKGEKVGVIRITGFDLTTPPQFTEAMDALIAENCQRFIFDVRNNPGGDLKSIEAVLSYFLNRGDTLIRVRDRDGKEESDKVQVSDFSVTNPAYNTCSVSASDIGKYREAALGKTVVLANGNTASAGELFTSAMRDYGIAVIIGETTFGKGSMQSIISLAPYGFDGAVKMTTRMYFPPLSDGYDGIGIKPDVEVPLAEELKNRNYLDIPDSEDNQIAAAIDYLGK